MTREELTVAKKQAALTQKDCQTQDPKASFPMKGRRLRFWEVDQCLKCPIMGMCLTLSESKRLLKKAGRSIKNLSPFDIHEALVASSDNDNALSRKVDRFLERKFGREAAPMFNLDDAAFLARFKQAFEAGDYIGMVWATAVRPGLALKTRREIFGDIHMTMHVSGSQHQQLKLALSRQQEKIAGLREQLKNMTGERRRLKKERDHLNHRHTSLKATLINIEREKARLAAIVAEQNQTGSMTALKEENARLTVEVGAMQTKLKDKQCLTIALKEKHRRVAAELDRHQQMIACFGKAQEAMSTQDHDCKACDTQCPAFDLCQRRVLIVGGLSRMEPLFRDLIEGRGGIFDYHDGTMKQGGRKLENRLRRADLVICPVNCNSHTACMVVKNLAKKHKKTVHMLPNSSLSSISQVILGNGDNQHTLN